MKRKDYEKFILNFYNADHFRSAGYKLLPSFIDSMDRKKRQELLSCYMLSMTYLQAAQTSFSPVVKSLIADENNYKCVEEIINQPLTKIEEVIIRFQIQITALRLENAILITLTDMSKLLTEVYLYSKDGPVDTTSNLLGLTMKVRDYFKYIIDAKVHLSTLQPNLTISNNCLPN